MQFVDRHIGPRENEINSMLKELGFGNLNELASKTIPKNILSTSPTNITAKSESEILIQLKNTMSKNKVYHSMIGMGFYDTHTPTVILRNVLENPAWYTAYTPYQAEISQGRMEALLNFQTMIKDLTAMEIANSSLLDEGTAVAEAMTMAHGLSKKKTNVCYVSEHCHPHVIEVLQTRAEPLGIELKLGNPMQFDFKTDIFAMILNYPQSFGGAITYKEVAEKAHAQGALVIVNTDLMALTLLSPPGEWGADIVTGNSQRFGVPLGFGGPHAAFMATKDQYKRSMPGRLVGVSVDADGNPAMRLTLQTREQHIRREKATSNICTAQVLLANMASFYAVYHGPKGIKAIATDIHTKALQLRTALQKLNYIIPSQDIFDTFTFQISRDKRDTILAACDEHKINFRWSGLTHVSISVNETTTPEHLESVVRIFNGNKAPNFALSDCLPKTISWAAPGLERKSAYLTHPSFNSYHSETDMLRYIHHLQNKDVSLTFSMIPLGSCTMKLNATTELIPVSWPEVNKIHPFVPMSQAQGYLEMIRELETQLSQLTGFAAVSLQPNAGSQGEYAGLLVIRKYHQTNNQGHRNICLIPSSAHGTNPASSVMAGFQVVVVECDSQGNVDLNDLKAKAAQHSQNLAALMITYPSTHGVFEESISEICQVIHQHGGQVYMDGANLNALVGLCKPGEFGPDVAHMNLHKTFAIPHGGGGPGVGPIGVAKHLKNFLPRHSQVAEAGPAEGISATTSAPWGSASILPISWSYINMMGATGLRQATLVAILNANYIAKKLSPYYPVLYKGREGLVAHECIIDLRELKKQSGIDVNDVAKRLMDYGFHAPTMSWPVAGTLMIEPTESESKAELDRFIEAMISIRQEMDRCAKGEWTREDNPLVNAPHTLAMLTADKWDHKYSRETAAYPVKWLREKKFWAPVRRVDNAYGDRHVVCACPSPAEYR